MFWKVLFEYNLGNVSYENLLKVHIKWPSSLMDTSRCVDLLGSQKNIKARVKDLRILKCSTIILFAWCIWGVFEGKKKSGRERKGISLNAARVLVISVYCTSWNFQETTTWSPFISGENDNKPIIFRNTYPRLPFPSIGTIDRVRSVL
jgi:hypothetical protein